MSKTVFLEVYSDSNFGAMIFQDKCNSQEVYESMVKEGVIKKEIEVDDEIVYVYIHEFGEVDPKFIQLAIDIWADYDSQKDHDLIDVTPVT